MKDSIRNAALYDFEKPLGVPTGGDRTLLKRAGFFSGPFKRAGADLSMIPPSFLPSLPTQVLRKSQSLLLGKNIEKPDLRQDYPHNYTSPQKLKFISSPPKRDENRDDGEYHNDEAAELSSPSLGAPLSLPCSPRIDSVINDVEIPMEESRAAVRTSLGRRMVRTPSHKKKSYIQLPPQIHDSQEIPQKQSPTSAGRSILKTCVDAKVYSLVGESDQQRAAILMKGRAGIRKVKIMQRDLGWNFGEDSTSNLILQNRHLKKSHSSNSPAMHKVRNSHIITVSNHSGTSTECSTHSSNLLLPPGLNEEYLQHDLLVAAKNQLAATSSPAAVGSSSIIDEKNQPKKYLHCGDGCLASDGSHIYLPPSKLSALPPKDNYFITEKHVMQYPPSVLAKHLSSTSKPNMHSISRSASSNLLQNPPLHLLPVHAGSEYKPPHSIFNLHTKDWEIFHSAVPLSTKYDSLSESPWKPTTSAARRFTSAANHYEFADLRSKFPPNLDAELTNAENFPSMNQRLEKLGDVNKKLFNSMSAQETALSKSQQEISQKLKSSISCQQQCIQSSVSEKKLLPAFTSIDIGGKDFNFASFSKVENGNTCNVCQPSPSSRGSSRVSSIARPGTGFSVTNLRNSVTVPNVSSDLTCDNSFTLSKNPAMKKHNVPDRSIVITPSTCAPQSSMADRPCTSSSMVSRSSVRNFDVVSSSSAKKIPHHIQKDIKERAEQQQRKKNNLRVAERFADWFAK